MMDSIFQYLDYRKFLKDFYELQKRTQSFFSYRYMGSKLGLDPSFLVKVFQQEKHIGLKGLPVLVKFLKLDSDEAKYLELLISFNKAKRDEDIKIFYEKLIKIRRSVDKQLTPQTFDFFNQWYHVAIYEFLRFHTFKGNFSEMGKKMRPSISAEKVKETIELLRKLKLIEESAEGTYKVLDDIVTTGEKWESIAIANFQKKMFEMGIDAMGEVAKSDRDVSTVTLSVSKRNFGIIRERLQEVRKELLEIAKDDKNQEAVMQFNFEVFPLTKWK